MLGRSPKAKRSEKLAGRSKCVGVDVFAVQLAGAVLVFASRNEKQPCQDAILKLL